MKKRNRILVALLAAISVLTAGCSGEIEQNQLDWNRKNHRQKHPQMHQSPQPRMKASGYAGISEEVIQPE